MRVSPCYPSLCSDTLLYELCPKCKVVPIITCAYFPHSYLCPPCLVEVDEDKSRKQKELSLITATEQSWEKNR